MMVHISFNFMIVSLALFAIQSSSMSALISNPDLSPPYPKVISDMGDNDPHFQSVDLEEAVQYNEVMHQRFPLKMRGCVPGGCRFFSRRSNVTYVWYAAYGSNMNYSRFLCYIRGGKVDGMRRPCIGSRDKSLPKGTMWKTCPHHLFFGRDRTETWGPGGVAFLSPKRSIADEAHIHLYRITLEQFNDVLLQENGYNSLSTVFNKPNLLYLLRLKSLIVGLKRGWYRNLVYLGKEKGDPILTITCSISDMERYKRGVLPSVAPSKSYANVIVEALVKGKRLSRDAAEAYIKKASEAIKIFTANA